MRKDTEDGEGPATYSEKRSLANYIEGVDIKFTATTNLDSAIASGTCPSPLIKDTRRSAYSNGVAVKRKCPALPCTDHHDAQLLGCVGKHAQLSKTEELNTRIKSANVTWYLFPGAGGQQYLPVLGMSVFDVKHATDDMIGAILRGHAHWLYRASIECEVFAVAVGSLAKDSMTLAQVAVLVGGLTGATAEQRQVLPDNLLSRMTCI